MISKIKNFIKSSPTILNLVYQVRFITNGNKRNINGTGNSIDFKGVLLKDTQFNIYGDNNKIIIGENSVLRGCKFNIRGSDHTVKIGNNGIYSKCNFATEDHHCTITIGYDVAMYDNCELAAVEPYSKVEIGNHCLFSSNIDIRNSDSHSIIDLVSKERINYAENIKLGDRVWVGAYVQILKGTEIGNESIIGIRSLVNSKVPANAIAVGIPAKVVKTNISWLNERIYKEVNN